MVQARPQIEVAALARYPRQRRAVGGRRLLAEMLRVGKWATGAYLAVRNVDGLPQALCLSTVRWLNPDVRGLIGTVGIRRHAEHRFVVRPSWRDTLPLAKLTAQQRTDEVVAMHGLGRRLRDLRDRRAMTQEQLAEKSAISSRTIQRIENADYEPRQRTSRALAVALGVDVSSLRLGFSDDQLIEIFERFACPYCGSPLSQRRFLDHRYQDTEVEEFECGYSRGWISRPCPQNPRFPKFEDYRLDFLPHDDETWCCLAFGLTDEARQVNLGHGIGRTQEEAAKWVQRSYVHLRYGYDAAEEFLPQFGTG